MITSYECPLCILRGHPDHIGLLVISQQFTIVVTYYNVKLL